MLGHVIVIAVSHDELIQATSEGASYLFYIHDVHCTQYYWVL